LEELKDPYIIDVIGVIIDMQEISEFNNQKTGEKKDKRVLTLADHTNKTVLVTLWGSAASVDGLAVGKVVALS
jgi:ssDNA-binding replication factor A large subunit